MAELITDMNAVGQPTSPAPNKKRQQANQGIAILDIFFLTLKRWPWIILSLLIFCGGAQYYILKTPTVYTRAAKIIIKKSSNNRNSGIADFSNFGLISQRTDIENELSSLQSERLMTDVVKRLGLDYDYYMPGKFHNVIAYGTSLPARIKIVDCPEDFQATMKVNITPGGKVKIYDLSHDGEKISTSFNGSLNKPISTAIGEIIVTPTAFYNPKKEIELIVYKNSVASTQQSFSSRLSVSQNDEKSSVINLLFSDRSVQRADNVLATLIEVYKDFWILDKNEITTSTSKFISERLGIIEDELGNVDSDISSFKSENLIPDIGTATGMYMSQNQQYSAAITSINDQIQLAKFVRSYLTDNSSRNQLLPTNAGLVGDIASQVSDYNAKLLERNTLVSKSSENNPLVQNLDSELASMRNAMVSTVDNQITALQTQLHSLKSSQSETTSKIATSPSQAKYLLSVERQQKVKEALYLFLLQKREENELTQAFTAYNTKVIKRPGPSGVPPTPAKGQILSIAALLGLALPFGVTFLLETNNTKVRGRKDIQHLNIPMLGEIPQNRIDPKAKKQDEDATDRTLVVKDGKRDVINEAFRVLRTNVEFMRGKGGGACVIAITSFNPGSGKSFISMNLGKTLALKGKRVLVIDGDMRHGSTSSYVRNPDDGMANYLAGNTDDLQSLLVTEGDDANFKILPVGPMPPNPTELLGLPRFGEMIEALRPQFDYILIDCPPIEIVADTQIIDQYVDRTIFIIRAGLLDRSMLPELEQIYDEKKYHNIALILNGTSLSRNRYGYGYGYRYGYGYGYGYGYYGSEHKHGKKKKK